MHRVECSFAHMWFEEKVTEGLVDKLSFSWMRLYSENENVVCCTFQKGDYRCQRHVISKANSLSTMFSSVRSLSCVRLFATPWTTAHQASLSITNSRSLPKLMSIESLMQFSHLILCRPLLLLPPIPRSIRVFSTTFSSVQISSVTSDSLQLHESQHARPPCPSPTPRVYPNSCASRRWCYPAISSFVIHFSSCPQSLPASGSFPLP